MGRASSRSAEEQTIYERARNNAGLTRAQAAEKMGFVTESRIEKIESLKAEAHPEDVIAMAEAYHSPTLCNQYCANECAIGRKYVPEVKLQSLPAIVLGILSSLNNLTSEKDRLIDITVDGVISDSEINDFARICNELQRISMTVDSINLWINTMAAEGKLDREKLEAAIARLK